MEQVVRIRVGFESVDSYGRVEWRSFKTADGARKAIGARLGAFEVGRGYIVSTDGVVKAYIVGTTVRDLFPAMFDEPAPMPRGYSSYEAMQGDPGHDGDEDYVDLSRPIRATGCVCDDAQLAHVGCDCHLARDEEDRTRKWAVPRGDEDMPF